MTSAATRARRAAEWDDELQQVGSGGRIAPKTPAPSVNPAPAPSKPRPAPPTSAPAAAPSNRLTRAAGDQADYLAGARPLSSYSDPGGASGGVAGFALGLVGTAVLINFMRGGTAGVHAWFSAKFLNVISSNAVKPAAPATPATPAAPPSRYIPASLTTLPGTSAWGAG